MASYVRDRLLLAFFVLWGALTIVFVAVRVIPGDPAMLMVGPQGSRQDVEAVRRRLGLDAPLSAQYGRYLAGALRLDFGQSLWLGKPAVRAVGERLPATALLAVTATVLGVGLGLPLGIVAAIRAHSPLDAFVRTVSLLGQSVPNFWLGIMLILVFARQLQWLPSSGMGELRHLVLPTVTLALLLVGVLTRLVRSGLVEVMSEDYIRSAYAKGLARAMVITKHALPNMLIPVVTIVGLQLGNLLAGAVIVETVFAWPGSGRLLVEAIGQRDYPVVQVAVLFITAAFIVINLLVDISYAYLDPRIRYR
ncbi:MAG: ABC transporter permease [Armatimonadota bacterium]|nr:ABC transporter permease [Armatimonadota bacterium]